ncbi:glucose 1-dehydrogenase [Acidovorax sp. LjRoot118]|uniref:SDR family NAD(P)-dependent oxidoreductase n=1 Tax=unclassified Acidovorax TaxID=2684926 RepID=UPI0007103D59|nr:glucose 1-dehydrogenase [Acidovorax sp. Root217]KRC25144.1 oxidoreductase [Acidovorax sp. Root217]
MTTLNGKVAIVTGASKGIGAGIARLFAQSGASVVVNYSTSKDAADALVAEIKGAGGKAVAIQADFSKTADIKRLFEESKRAFGTLDILVNNAGVYAFGPLETATEQEFHREFTTNVLGVITATQEAARYFGPNGGSIINISSIASVGFMPNSVIYAASKSAVDAITRVTAMELAPKNIRVNTLAPGGTITEGIAALGWSEETVKAIVATIPFGRPGKPQDIARVALFLASDDSAWVTGERITASGGQRA